MAGALEVELGGINYYLGKPAPKPTLGDPITPLRRRHISEARAIMWTTSLQMLLILVAFRLLAS